MMSEGEERGGKFKEILLIKRESTTRGDGINQSFALMRHLLIMPGREVVMGGLGGAVGKRAQDCRNESQHYKLMEGGREEGGRGGREGVEGR